MRKREDASLLIKRRYIDPVDPNKVAGRTIGGMIESLDPHSSYIDASAFKEVEQHRHGKLVRGTARRTRSAAQA